MVDPRNTEYAELLVGTCVDVQPGWQVLVGGGVLGRPLVEEVIRSVARRGAHAVLRLSFDGEGVGAGGGLAWLGAAPDELVDVPASLDARTLEGCDALIVVRAPENTRERAQLDADRLTAYRAAYRPFEQRFLDHATPWVLCQYPTPALAQEAGMSTEAFAEFLYGACLLDWGAEAERMRRYAERFDAASEVRIVGEGTDLTLSMDGRRMRVDAGGSNMPGGEFFGCPVESSADGVITFSEFPTVHGGRELRNVRLRFASGRVVESSADTEQAYLHETLASDVGASALGEIGIGCNPGITQYMRNTGFDEKMDGTVHLALGSGFPDLGGTNVSRIHWDIVKDLRLPGSRIELDGETVQQDGRWLA